MITLRPYQQDFVNRIRTALAQWRHVIACAATGAGKTKCFISISHQAITAGRTVLILSESTKIFKQIHAEIGNCVKIADGVKHVTINSNFVYVAMAQTLARRPAIIEELQRLGGKLLIISDEAHISTSSKLQLQLPDAYQIGFTATPDYRTGKHLPLCYKGIVIGPQPQELIESGHLAPYYHYERKIVNLKNLKKSSTGDFTEQSQESAFEKKEVFDGLFDDLLKFEFKKCIIYCASIKHCMHVTERLRSVGYEVSEVHSKNPKSDAELARFMIGNVKLCVSVGSLTKGWDFPAIDLVVLHRATASLALFAQMCGRGARTLPGKSHFRVLDYGGNASRHGLWNFTHDWETMWLPPKKRSTKEGAAPVRCCPTCGYMMHASAPQCPECKFIFPKAVQTPKETALIEMTTQYNGLRGRKMSSLTAQELAVYVKITNRKMFGQRIAKARGDAFLNDYAKQMGWTYGWWNYTVADETLDYADIEIK
jgi:superfamily II DNA or RNA helicase